MTIPLASVLIKSSISDGLLYIFVAIIIIGVLIYNYFFSREAIVKRKLRKTEGKKISSFMEGEVAKVKGSIKYIGDPITAPLSNRKCSYYYILVEELRSSGKSSSWHTLIEEEIAGNVVIRDGRDYAVIETGTVKSYLVQDRQYTSGLMNDATSVLNEYLQKHGYDSVGYFGMNKRLRYKEGILEENEIIAVVGKASWKRKSEIKLDIPAERILVICPDEQEPVFFSDDPEVTE